MNRMRARRFGALVESLDTRRLLTFGLLDPAFGGGDGKVSTDLASVDEGRAVLETANGKIIVAATDFIGNSPDFGVARYSADGTLEQTYGATFGLSDFVTDAALQRDGKLVVVGYSDIAGNNNFAIARFNTNGTLDTSFDGDGKVLIDFAFDDRAAAVVVQDDGKIVVAGSMDGGSSDFAVARINTNGTLDNTFGSGGRVSNTFGGADFATSLALDAFGRIVVAGYTNLAGSNDMAVMRLTTNGGLDTSFDSDGLQTVSFGGDDRANAVQVDSASRIVLAGSWNGGSSDFAIARLTFAGALDVSFDNASDSQSPGKVNLTFDSSSLFGGAEFATGVALTAGDGIIISGYTDAVPAGTSHGITNNFAAAKLTQSGSFDIQFGNGGQTVIDMGANDLAYGMTLTRDNSLLIAGGSNNDTVLLRLRGALDITFGGDGRVTTAFGDTDSANAVVVQPDGKYIVAGSWDGGTSDFALARYNPDGSLDASFDNPTDASPAGQVNLTFGLSGFGGAEFATDLVLQPDGKIVVVGYTNNINGTAASGGNDFAICRLNANGTLDTSFSGDGKFTINFGNDDRANAVALQPNGKIVVVGSWDGGASEFAAARINADGTLDSSFSGDGLATLTFGNGLFGGAEYANDVAILPNGKIVLVGFTDDINGVPATGGFDTAIAVLEPNGALATSFSGDGKFTIDLLGDDRANAVAIDAQSKVVVGVTSGIGSALADFTILRLMPDGNLDTTFDSDGRAYYPMGAEEALTDILVTPDNKIVAGGYSNFPGPTGNSLAAIRVLNNGTIDRSFQPPDEGGFLGHEFRYNYGSPSVANGIALNRNGGLVMAGVVNGDFAVAVLHAGRVEATQVEYLFDGSPFGFTSKPATRVWFSNQTNLSSVANTDFVLTNTTTGAVIPASQLSIDASIGGGAVDIRYTGNASGIVGVLPNGNYTLQLNFGSIGDTAGNTNVGRSFTFFVLAGDFNRDRTVNFDDLLIVSQSYGTNSKRFSQGNADYSANGAVGFDDLLITSQNYGHSVFSAMPIAGSGGLPWGSGARETMLSGDTTPASVLATLDESNGSSNGLGRLNHASNRSKLSAR